MTAMQKNVPFNDEIDLGQYLRALLNRWPWIVLTTVIGALAAAAFSLLVVSPTYEATAWIAITPPKYLMQFSPEFRALAQERIQAEIYGTYPELAESDELMQQVSDALDGGLDEPISLESLRSMALVRTSKDLGLIYLSIRDSDPERAALIVNIWAQLYRNMLNELYSSQQGEYDFFAVQLVSARDNLNAAQEALAEFKARDPSALLSSDLKAKVDALDGYLATQSSIESQEQTIESWRQQLAAQPNDRPVSRIDELTAFFIQLEAFGIVQERGQPQFQVSLEQVAEGWSRTEQIAFLDNLDSFLQSRSAELETLVTELRPEILRLQQELQVAENEQARLSQEVKLAESLHESLALKAEEARITSESEVGIAQLASKAAVPSVPTGPRKLFIVAIGTALGFAVGVALVLALELLQSFQSVASGNGSGDGSGD